MKKLLALILVCAMALSMVACSGKKDSDKDDSKPTSTATPEAAPEGTDTPDTTPEVTPEGTETPDDPGNTPLQPNPVELVFHPATSAATGAYATIKVSADIKMDDESAWLGLCPAGKDYITELEADEVDVVYFYAEAREDGEPYVFACDFESVEDGTYALTISTSDDENVGYVVIQLSMTKDGDKITFDYTDAKIKERPAK